MIIISYSLLILLFSFHFDQIHSKSDKNGKISNTPYFETPLGTRNSSHLFWTVDYDAEIVTLEVRISRHSKYEWFAIGFSDYGQITNADLCVLWYDNTNNAHFQDAFTDEYSLIFVDEQSNDCIPLEFRKKGRIVRFVLQRKFDTCDPKDYVIEDGTTHIVYATGKGPLKRLNGVRLSDHEHGFQRIQMLKNLDPILKLPHETKTIEIINDHVHIPSDETTYWCSIHLLPKDIEQKHHIIQYESVIQQENTDIVHHMEVFHCEVSSDVEIPVWNDRCVSPERPKILDNCKRVLAAWAMGAQALQYPPEAGLPIGGANFSRYVMLEIHYNNVELRSDSIDSSGIRFYYTPKLRRYDAGVLEIGLEYTDKNSIPPKQEAFDLSGYCTSECTRIGLPSDGITIFASQLHTHLTGIRVWTRHIRGGVELDEVNRDNHYSTHFQEIRKLKKPVHVLPGDALINVCRYNTVARNNITLGGYAISEEMCVNYMHYFPKTNLEVCKSSIDSQTLGAYFRYMNVYEGESSDKNKTVQQNYQSIAWNLNKARFLNKLYQTSPLSMQCNQSSGDRFAGYWNGIPVTPIYWELPKRRRNCDKREL